MPRMRFERGPTAAMMILSLLGCDKLFGLNVTGFAQPNPAIKMNAMPSKSKCLSGSSVSLPCDFAVESPSLYAARA